MPFSPTSEIIDELKAGRIVVLTDDEDRENEGDLVCLAEHIDPDKINFMLRARGWLCLSLSADICERLELSVQTKGDARGAGTAFTETIDATEGISTGVSTADRCRTIRTAIRTECRPQDLVKPGHLQPLRARRGGVLVRPGHTEGSVDLARLCGSTEAAVIIEIMKDDGTMARLADLEGYIAEHGLKMGSIADLIEYRRRKEKLVVRTATTRLPTRFGNFDVHLYESPYDEQGHLVLVRGIDLPEDGGPGPVIDEAVMGRVHSECFTGDVLGSMRCDCADQLHMAMQRVAKEEKGFILYMRQEGRGIGLANKLRAYQLQDGGLDTVEANRQLGFEPDQRNYGTGAQILHDLGIRKLRLLTNNPRKRKGLAGYGLEIVERLPIEIAPNPENARYLDTKRDKLGHLLGGVD